MRSGAPTARVGTAPVLILDTMGELPRTYNLASAAYVGGGLTPDVGLHNLLEPLFCGAPVLFGHHHGKAARIASEFLRLDAGIEIRSGPALTDALRTVLSDGAERARLHDAGQRLLAEHRGAAERQADAIRGAARVMTVRSLIVMLWLLAAVVFVPPVLERRPLEVRLVDEIGRDTKAPAALATVDRPDRSSFSFGALWVDFSYAAAAAGPAGCGAMILCIGVLSVFLGMWCRGFTCAMRRLLVTIALGIPLAIALLYSSCFLDGRTFRFGPEASRLRPREPAHAVEPLDRTARSRGSS